MELAGACRLPTRGKLFSITLRPHPVCGNTSGIIYRGSITTPWNWRLLRRSRRRLRIRFRRSAPGRSMRCSTVRRDNRLRHAGRSLVAQSRDGVEAGSLQRRPETEEQTDTDGDTEAGDHGPQRYGGRQVGDESANGDAEQPTNQDADQAPGCGEGHGFQQKLPNDIAAPRADGLAYADFPGPLSDRHQHDVHHSDSTHQQADGSNHDHDQAHRGYELAELVDDRLGA